MWQKFAAPGQQTLPAFLLFRIVEHKAALFDHVRQRWQELFQALFDVLLYDLTSTYIEGEGEEIPKAKYGYSRDHRRTSSPRRQDVRRRPVYSSCLNSSEDCAAPISWK